MNPSSNAALGEVSVFRLYLLRVAYLFIAVGLAVMIWPGILSPPADLSHMAGVVRSVLGAVSLLAILGLRYPLMMLPVLFFELIWKSIWVLAFWLPHWPADQLSPGMQQTFIDCLVGIVLVLAVVPWGYVYHRYVKTPGDRWRRAGLEVQDAP